MTKPKSSKSKSQIGHTIQPINYLPSQKLLYKTLGIKPKVRGTQPFKRYTPGLFSQHLMCGVPQLNLILKVCTRFYPIDINSTELKLIHLLLKVGAHPNVVDSNNYTTLHILSTKESRNCRIWSYCISELHHKCLKISPRRLKRFWTANNTTNSMTIQTLMVYLHGSSYVGCSTQILGYNVF